MNWTSKLQPLGHAPFPAFTGLRILMMPFRLHDLGGTLPPFAAQYFPMLAFMAQHGPCAHGVAYLTIDERSLQKGQFHRRPGLHVDGWHDDSDHRATGGGNWGGGGGAWGSRRTGHGMLLGSNFVGAAAYAQEFSGEPKKFGDCEHLRSQCVTPHYLAPGEVYHCDGMTVHESVPVLQDCNRQFVRLSMPSDGDWNSSNTPNPLGVLPEGNIIEARPESFTRYRPCGP